MYSVNILVIHGYEVKVASGTPSIKLNDKGKGLTFYSSENFELHVMKDGQQRGIITPGGR